MIQKSHAFRKQVLMTLMAGVAGVGFTAAATAAGLGVNAEVGADAKLGAPVDAKVGAGANAHMDAAGSAKRNAQSSSEAVKAETRAAERQRRNGIEPGMASETELDATGKVIVKGKHADPR
jgi:hypothetical protein